MMDSKTLEQYLHDHIPISRALGISITSLSNEAVIVRAPFTNNINHKMTAFGGSLHAVATLSCWCLMYQNLFDILSKVEIVISQSHVNFLSAVTTDFQAICLKPDNEDWEKLLRTLSKKGKARIVLNAKISQDGQLAVDYEGTFVVLMRRDTLCN